MAPRRAQWLDPDYTAIRQQLQTHKHVTLQLLWEEYREQHPDDYRYSRYCELYRRWLRHIKRWRCVTSIRPARSCLSTTPVRPSPSKDPATGEVRQAQLFVAVLFTSNYTFAEATWTQGLGDWIGSHMRAFEFFQLSPAIVVPDKPEVGRDQGLPLRARRQPGLRGNGRALWGRRRPSAAL